MTCTNWINWERMIIDGLYAYETMLHEDGEISAIVTWNRKSHVYKGHFPGLAVTPGVCQLLMIKEILEGELGLRLLLCEAKNIKFTSIHEPDRDNPVEVKISYMSEGNEKIKVRAAMQKGETIYLKFKGEFIRQN